jgi:hypothetical protein
MIKPEGHLDTLLPVTWSRFLTSQLYPRTENRCHLNASPGRCSPFHFESDLPPTWMRALSRRPLTTSHTVMEPTR